MSVNRTSLGKRISFYRSKSTLTQEALAAKVNCSREYMLVFHYSPFLLHSTTTSLYTDCSNNLYAGSPSYLLILFSALSAFAVVG